ncbi:GGDEF domain-containing protein [Kineococcus gynurae]|uniref:GGDEF domain-containing protein n=1 Tax=Kineococcus gynurae TaxID=452979 RepID=A0ABV5LWA3_9ACTN
MDGGTTQDDGATAATRWRPRPVPAALAPAESLTGAGARSPAPERAARTRVLAWLVIAAVVIGVTAALDPTTLRPGWWSLGYVLGLVVGAASAVALLTVGRSWPDTVLAAIVVLLMGVVVLSVLANQSRSGGMLDVVLLLPLAVYAAVHLARRVCRVVLAVLVVAVAVVMGAVADGALQWATLTLLPSVAFLGTVEVVLALRSSVEGAVTALHRQALTDPLTGLQNRRALQERVDGALGDVTTFTTVLTVDVDHFKSVNDALGHDAGDAVLRRLGAGLREGTRGDDVVIRMGGEEFLVLSSTPADDAGAYAETLRVRAAEWLRE